MDLRVAVRGTSRASAAHLEVTAPARVDVLTAIVDVLRAEAGDAAAVRWATRPTEEVLRGRGARAGLLAEADGGFVVVDALDLVDAPERWRALREAMSFGTVERLAAPAPDATAPAAPPEVDPTRVAVVVIGPDAAVRKLREADERASELLRTRLEWSSDVARAREDALLLVASLRRFVADAGIVDVTPGAYAALLEALTRTARRGRLASDLRPAEEALSRAHATRSPGAALDRRAIRTALGDLRERSGAREEAHRRRADLGQLRIDTTGTISGVVNGLMVYGQQRQAYAMPGRITASIAVGREGLINVERESKYSGRSFDKGVFVLAGLMRSLFGRTSPLGLAATLTFEQSYGRVDGDSATLAEAVAVLSCAALLPCRQDVAVSGSINTRGEVLPVGSVTLKVEGWYQTCLAAGLTGTQGVVLPRGNVPDLQLGDEVTAAIAEGRFAIWAVDTVDQALEVVLGRSAGRRPGKSFVAGSVYGRAAHTMQRMSERLYPPRKQPPKEGAAASKTVAAPPVTAPEPTEPEG